MVHLPWNLFLFTIPFPGESNTLTSVKCTLAVLLWNYETHISMGETDEKHLPDKGRAECIILRTQVIKASPLSLQQYFPFPLNRHLLNVTWEQRDFSFNEGGYLIRPTMVVISLNRHRLWKMVRTLCSFFSLPFLCVQAWDHARMHVPQSAVVILHSSSLRFPDFRISWWPLPWGVALAQQLICTVLRKPQVQSPASASDGKDLYVRPWRAAAIPSR